MSATYRIDYADTAAPEEVIEVRDLSQNEALRLAREVSARPETSTVYAICSDHRKAGDIGPGEEPPEDASDELREAMLRARRFRVTGVQDVGQCVFVNGRLVATDAAFDWPEIDSPP